MPVPLSATVSVRLSLSAASRILNSASPSISAGSVIAA